MAPLHQRSPIIVGQFPSNETGVGGPFIIPCLLLQGRVNSVFRLIAFGGQPIGVALIGWLIQNIGVRQTIISCSIFLALFAILATVNTHVRHAQPRAV
jgi:hypothetical protein